MSFLNKAKAQAQKSMEGASTGIPTVKSPVSKPGIPKPPISKPGLPPKPNMQKPGVPKPSIPKPKDETPLAAKANPFLKKNVVAKEEEIPQVTESIEKDPALIAPIEEAKAEIEAAKAKEKNKKDNTINKEESKEEISQVTDTEQIETVKEEEKPTEEVKQEDNDKKEEIKETKKKSNSRRKSSSKAKENTENKTKDIEVTEIPVTEIEYAEAMSSIRSNFVDPEWETFRQEIIDQLNEINITSDMTSSALKETISNLSSLRESIWIQYNDTKTAYENLTSKEPEGLIERIKKLNASGSNAEERKINSILAVMNYKDGSGRNINLFELLDETRERYNFLKSVMDSSQYKTNVLITMLGSLKLEK